MFYNIRQLKKNSIFFVYQSFFFISSIESKIKYFWGRVCFWFDLILSITTLCGLETYNSSIALRDGRYLISCKNDFILYRDKERFSLVICILLTIAVVYYTLIFNIQYILEYLTKYYILNPTDSHCKNIYQHLCRWYYF